MKLWQVGPGLKTAHRFLHALAPKLARRPCRPRRHRASSRAGGPEGSRRSGRDREPSAHHRGGGLESSGDPARSPGSERGEPARAFESSTRRRFITWLSQAFLGLWGLGAVAAIASYLRAPERGGSAAERIVRVGLLEDLPIGEGRLVRHGTQPFYIVRMDAARVIALSAVCTHVRCIVGYDR